MRILSFGLALAAILAVASPTFAACEAFYGPRDIDRPVASVTNASITGPVTDGADYTDWATIAETTPLSVTTGGFEIVILGVYDVTDPAKPYKLTDISNNGTNFVNKATGEICNN